MKRKLLTLSLLILISIYATATAVYATNGDYYENYDALSSDKIENKEYRIEHRDSTSNIAVIAIHGGGIEPGTTELADKIAARKFDYYSFVGKMKSGNRILHITSTNFDEPTARALVKETEKTLSIHGCSGSEKITYIGGLDKELSQKVKQSLIEAGFTVKDAPSHLSATSAKNICNDNAIGAGVQIELSTALRATFYKDLSSKGRKTTTNEFEKYTSALAYALEN